MVAYMRRTLERKFLKMSDAFKVVIQYFAELEQFGSLG